MQNIVYKQKYIMRSKRDTLTLRNSYNIISLLPSSTTKSKPRYEFDILHQFVANQIKYLTRLLTRASHGFIVKGLTYK